LPGQRHRRPDLRRPQRHPLAPAGRPGIPHRPCLRCHRPARDILHRPRRPRRPQAGWAGVDAARRRRGQTPASRATAVRGRVPWPELALAALCAAAAAALVVAGVSSSESSGTVEQRAHAVASTLKCPVCHDLSAADSPAPVAQQMRAQITEELRAGRTPDQIRAEFVTSYGEWILLSPPQRGLDLLPWLAPAFLGCAGL